MAIKVRKPTTPGTRHRVDMILNVAAKRPEKSLRFILKKNSGRNHGGRITVRHQGGRHKRFYRVVDFKREKRGVAAVVAAIEYDPNRSANIALLIYADGDKRYILAPVGLKVGQPIMSGEKADILPGNCLPLANIPIGSEIHNLELKPKAGGKLVRSAGMVAQLVGKDAPYAQIRLPSGEIRKILLDCKASIGQVGNAEHENIVIGKAGRQRHLGWRPHVRGTAMNPVDHPHGGGEGRTKGGRHPVTPWGFPTKGKKTRNNNRTTKYILKDRRI